METEAGHGLGCGRYSGSTQFVVQAHWDIVFCRRDFLSELFRSRWFGEDSATTLVSMWDGMVPETVDRMSNSNWLAYGAAFVRFRT